MSNLASRLAVAAVGVPIVLGDVYLGGWWMFALLAPVAAVSLHEFWLLVTTYPDVLAAAVALGLLILAGVVSFRSARRRLRYETWWAIHLYTYLALALAFAHQLANGAAFVGHDAGLDGHVGQAIPVDHLGAVDQQQRPQLHGVSIGGGQPLDQQGLALLDPVLLSACLDDRVHG